MELFEKTKGWNSIGFKKRERLFLRKGNNSSTRSLTNFKNSLTENKRVPLKPLLIKVFKTNGGGQNEPPTRLSEVALKRLNSVGV